MGEHVDKKILEYSSKEEMRQLVSGEHSDPHRVLGVHPVEVPNGTVVIIRAFHPDAESAEVFFDDGKTLPMTPIHPGGLFATAISGRPLPFLYRLRFRFHDGNTWEGIDPYRFLPTLGEVDLYLMGEGTHQQLYR